MQTVPTGLLAVPPVGPAMPEMASAKSALREAASRFGHGFDDGFGDGAVDVENILRDAQPSVLALFE